MAAARLKSRPPSSIPEVRMTARAEAFRIDICQAGSSCRYAHGLEELRSNPSGSLLTSRVEGFVCSQDIAGFHRVLKFRVQAAIGCINLELSFSFADES